MIRPITPQDTPALLALCDSVGLFGPGELDELAATLAAFDLDGKGNGEFWLADDEKGGLVGVAYCAPERMTSGTWNLLLIAVHPDRQSHGRGAALLRRVETILGERGARLLLVETVADMEQARAFYHKRGFEEEARIRDYYDAGADKIIFRKTLAGANTR